MQHPFGVLTRNFRLIRLRKFRGQQPARHAGDGETRVASAKCLMSWHGHLLRPVGISPPCFSFRRSIVDLLFNVLPFHGLWEFCVCLVLISIVLKRKRKLVALLLLSYRCNVTINVLWLFLTVPWVGLQYVIVVFPDHTHHTPEVVLKTL